MTDTHTIALTNEVDCAGESLILDYQKCCYWPASKILMLADVHLGKEAVFQRQGMAIPDGSGESNIAQIRRLLTQYQPQQLVILGDLVHALPSLDESWIISLHELIEQFQSVTVTVISGNHDKPGTASRLPDAIQWSTELALPPFRFLHEAPVVNDTVEAPTSFTISGHLHPCYSLGSRKGASVRMPVFWIGKNKLVLPAFGEFTGMKKIKPRKNDSLFGVGPDGIVNISTAHNRISRYAKRVN